MRVGIKVKEIMNKKPVCISPKETIPACARKMLSNNVGGIIVEENKKLVGIITEKDIVEDLVGKELNVKKLKVSDIMTTGMIQISPEADIMEAVELMIREDVRRLPVTNNKKLVGIITAKDLLKKQPGLYKRFHNHLTK